MKKEKVTPLKASSDMVGRVPINIQSIALILKGSKSLNILVENLRINTNKY